MTREKRIGSMRTARSGGRDVVAGLVLLALLAGCGVPGEPTPTQLVSAPESQPSEQASAADMPSWLDTASRVANAQTTRLRIYDGPGGEVVHRLPNPGASGSPLVLLTIEDAQASPEWVKVQVPVRPNGTAGWVRAEDIWVSTVRYRLEVSTDDRTLTLFHDGDPVEEFPVAVGTGGTPTPTGSFYLVELIAPTNAGYGPYAFGLSAFSDVLNSFGGGPGQIGLHGTDNSGSIGTAASHGCIRMHNDDIVRLAEILPLGTPIDIV